MQSRLGQVLLIAALIVPFAGCPGSTAIRLGEWSFEIDEDGTLYSIILYSNGTAEVPAGAAAIFNGTLTWTQDETVFRMNQQISSDIWVYTSTSLSRTSMEGVITGPNMGTWTASFVK